MIREYQTSDLEALEAMHKAQGFNYPFPNLADELYLSKLVLTNGNDRAKMALALRLTSEAYMFHTPKEDTPQERWQHFVELHEAMREDALRRGLSDVHVWLSPRIERPFGKRLATLGWQKALWSCFTLELERKVVHDHGQGR